MGAMANLVLRSGAGVPAPDRRMTRETIPCQALDIWRLMAYGQVMATDDKDLGELIGGNVRRARGSLTQDELAGRVRRWGLAWSRSVVGAVETGARRLEPGELPLLCLALGVEMADLLAGEGSVALTQHARMDAGALRRAFTGGAHTIKVREVDTTATSRNAVAATFREATDEINLHIALLGPETDLKVLDATVEAAAGEAERKAAKKLGASTVTVSAASFALWGRSLTDERDGRMTASLDARSRQAKRGHVTRVLLGELQARIEQVGGADGQD